MLGHKASLSKFKKSEIISSIFSDPQQYETRNPLHEESWKIHKYMEIKQHATEQTVSQRGNQRKRKKQLEINLNENRTYKI